MPIQDSGFISIGGGVSQEAHEVRQPNKVTSQVNMLSSVTKGVSKRPMSLQYGTIDTGVSAAQLYVDEVTDTKYNFVFTGDAPTPLRIFNEAGVEQTVVFDANTVAYLTTTAPRSKLKILKVEDDWLVLNKEKTTEMIVALQDVNPPDAEGLIIVDTLVPNTNYNLKMKTISTDGLSWNDFVEVTVNSGTDNTVTFLENLKSAIITELTNNWGIDGMAMAVDNDQLRIFDVTKAGEAVDYRILFTTDSGPAGVRAIHGHVTSESELPTVAPLYFKIAVGDAVTNTYYFVFYNAAGEWEETRYVNSRGAYSFATVDDLYEYIINNRYMPVSISKTDTTEFTVSLVTWDTRDVGNEVTAPLPSFIDHTITDMFIYRNRLGFISGSNIIFSKAGSFFDFFPDTAKEVLPTDPIDISVSAQLKDRLLYAEPINERLMFFGADKQFTLGTQGTPLTPSTVAIDPATTYDIADVAPVSKGSELFFAVPKGVYADIREYFVNVDTQVQSAYSITTEVPEYITNNISKLMASTRENMLFVFSDDSQNNIYVYQWEFGNEGKILSAWSTWTFMNKIIDAYVIENELWLLMLNEAGTSTVLARAYLENRAVNTVIPSLPELPAFPLHLDRTSVIEGTYVSEFNLTTFNTGGTYDLGYIIVDPDTLEVFEPTNDSIEGDQTNGNGTRDFLIGYRYPSELELTKWFIRDRNGNPMLYGRLQTRTATFSYYDTNMFTIEVNPYATIPSASVTVDYKFTGARLGITYLNQPRLYSGSFKVPIHSNNRTSSIKIISNDITPFNISGLVYNGLWSRLSNWN